MIQIRSYVEAGSIPAVLREAYILSVYPQVEERVHTVKINEDFISTPLMPSCGKNERPAVRTHLVGVLVGCIALILRLAHHTLAPVIYLHLVVENHRLVHIDGNTIFHSPVLLESLHIPASGNFNIVPGRHIKCRLVKVLGSLLRRSHPMELPHSVQTLIVGASLRQHLQGLMGIGKGEQIGTWLLLVQRQQLRVLPLRSVGSALFTIKKTLQVICLCHQGKSKQQ